MGECQLLGNSLNSNSGVNGNRVAGYGAVNNNLFNLSCYYLY